MVTLQEVENHNCQWFAPGNKRFFGDRSYSIVHNKAGVPFLLRSTYQWSDMFGKKKKLCYRINRIDPDTLKIKSLLDEVFVKRSDAKMFIKYLDL